MRRGRWIVAGLLAFGLTALGSLLLPVAAEVAYAGADDRPRVPDAVRDRIQRDGSLRVIVELRLPAGVHQPEGRLRSAAAAVAQRRDIASVQSRVLVRLAATAHRTVHRYRTVPFVALEIDPAALAELEASGEVLRVAEDRLLRPLLAESVPLIEADLAWDMGFGGAGTLIAIVDSGVDKDHPFLAGRVVEEACYASGGGGSCPDGSGTQIGSGAGVPCPFAPLACAHGTHVAGIAAGTGAAFSGVARAAQLMAIQVFHRSTDCLPFEENPCARAFSSDIGAALERVFDLRDEYTIAAANLSLGAGAFDTYCDGEDPQLTAQIANLRSVGIPTVVASGNEGYIDALAFPACISSAISVGSTTKTDDVSWFSNVAPFMSLFAPGSSIYSSVPGGDFAYFDGSSMAAPHVAGTWAIMKQATPGATVDGILETLQQTGLPVTDDRLFPFVTKPRIRVLSALGIELPAPVLTGIAPSTVAAWGPGFTLTVTGSDFVRSSVVRINGVNRPTVYVGSTSLTAAIPASDLATSATSLQVDVFTPSPGGGLSGAATLTLTQPSLSVSATTVASGGQVTATLTNGAGGAQDWLALATVGASNQSYLQWIYVGAGVTTRTWTVTLPIGEGTYEFRFFPNNGFVRAATSPTVTVLTPTLTVSATTVPAGGQVTATLENGFGGAQDWLALAAAGAPNNSYLQWTYVGAGVTTRTWTVTLPTTSGGYEFRFFPNNGYARAATSPTVTVPSPAPTISSLSPASVATGGPAFTLTVFGTGFVNGSVVRLNGDSRTTTYVSAAQLTATIPAADVASAGSRQITVANPSPGGGVSNAAALTVTSDLPAPTITSLSHAAVAVGSPGFTLTVTGTGFVSQSVIRVDGVARATGFVSSTQLTTSIAAAELTTPRTASVPCSRPPPAGALPTRQR